MLELVLPPIIIVAALGLLFWLFYKKRDVLAKLSSVQKISGAMRPPKFMRPQDQSSHKSEPKHSDTENKLLGRAEKMMHSSREHITPLIGKMQKFSGVDAMQRAGKKVRSAVLGRKEPEGLHQGALQKGIESKMSENFDEQEESLQQVREKVDMMSHRTPATPQRFTRKTKKRRMEMVSEAITKPQQRDEQEKDQYEQILVERIALNPKDIEAYERLGDYYLEWQSYQDAKECYKQVLRLSPMNRRAKIRMRRIEKILG